MWIADGTVERQRDHSSDAGDRLEIAARKIVRCDVAHLPVKSGDLLSQSLGNVDERLQIDPDFKPVLSHFPHLVVHLSGQRTPSVQEFHVPAV
jgi:hypothetical protein